MQKCKEELRLDRQLCDDFKMPISRDDLLEIFRVKALRSKTKIHNKLDLEVFKDTL